DDHLRNHAFLRDAKGWRLSPAFDMNPCPIDVKPRIHALAIDELDGTASLDIVFSVAARFGIRRDEADTIVAEVGAAVSSWRSVAKALKLKPSDIDRMASAFEHDDLRQAVRAKRLAAPTRTSKAAPARKSKTEVSKKRTELAKAAK